MLKRWRQLPPLAYGALAVSLVGVTAELLFHFLPPQTVPAFDAWLTSLTAADREFFSTGLELLAHFFIGLGLTGMITALVQLQLKNS